MNLLLQLLEDAGVDFHTTGKPDEVTLCCPFCDDTKFHLGLNTRDGRAHCFRCNWAFRGVVETGHKLAEVFGVGIRPSIRRQKPHHGAGNAGKRHSVEALKPTLLPVEYESLIGNQDHIAKDAFKYLAKRGVTSMQIISHKIGVASWGVLAGRVLFPVYGKHEKVYGCVGRALYDDLEPKYRNTSGAKVLWNGYKKADTAILCEGIMDALSVERALLSWPENAIALGRLGSTLTDDQIEQLKKYQRVIALPDCDRPGVTGVIATCEACFDAKINIWVSVPQFMDGRDPGDMGPSEIIAWCKSAVEYNDSARLMLKLSMTRGLECG